MDPQTVRTLAVVPCFNEARSVLAVIQELKAGAVPLDVLVVDDGSTDDTGVVAASVANTLRLSVNLGIGGAVQAGILYAARGGYDFCLQFDGDGQHRADQVAGLFAAQRATGANVVIGSRFLAAGGFRSSGARRLGIAMIARALRTLFGVAISDPTSGFRLMDREAIRLYAVRYPADFPEPLAIALAVEAGLRVAEAAAMMRERQAGESSIAGLKTLAYMARVLGYLIVIRFGRRL